VTESGKVHRVKPLERSTFGGQWTDERERWKGASWESVLGDMRLEDSGQMSEKGGKVHSVKPLERRAFGREWAEERERWKGA